MNNHYQTRTTPGNRLFGVMLAVFFFLMLFVPTTYQLQRGLLLALLVSGGAIAAASGRWRVSLDILVIWLLSLSLGAFGIFWGTIHNTPGAISVATVFIVWPILYMLFIGLVHSQRTIILCEKTIVIGVFASSVMIVALLLGAVTGHGREVMELFAFQGAAYGLYSGYIELSSYNLSTVVYGLPFLATLYFLPRTDGWVKRRWKIGCLLLLVLTVCLASGRRAFWMVALVTPIIIGCLMLVSGIRFRVRYWVAGFGVALLILMAGSWLAGVEIKEITDSLVSGFDFSGAGEQSASARVEQFNALMSGWSESPVLGQGLGASTAASIRSEDMPWAYELSYIALLYQAGLLGTTVYSMAVLWIFYAGIKIVRSQPSSAQIILPLLAGLAGFLLANATNPYLSKFDYLWTIFLPVAAINAYRTSK